MKDLCYIWNCGQCDGLVLEFYELGQVLLDELKVILDVWLGGKQVCEKGFFLGCFILVYLNFFCIVIVCYQGKLVVFVNLLEIDSCELVSFDLMCVYLDVLKLIMEFFMFGFIFYYKVKGYVCFSFGMVLLVGFQLRCGVLLIQCLGVLVFWWGEQFYNFQGL